MTEHYEMLYILPISYTPEETKPINEKIANLIKENDGTISKEGNLGKNKLAYPIKQQSHGYYFLYEFDLPRPNLQKLTKSLHLTAELVRFLIAKKKIKTVSEIEADKRLQEKLAKRKEKEIEKMKAESASAKAPADKEKQHKEKISLEDLDKKLDEILDTNEIM